MKISDITKAMEQLAPPSLQENYDNAGLIAGNPSMPVNGALVCLDSLEEVVDEAIALGCNLVIAHHPIVFRGLKKINGNNYVERTLIKAVKNDIAIYAIHTNLDNVYHGVNRKIAERLGLEGLSILAPKEETLSKLVTFAPEMHAEAVRSALFAAGAGAIGNYTECSFNLKGIGTFKANEGANPYAGEEGNRHEEKEERIEVIFESWKQRHLIQALKDSHPYEEVAYDCYALSNLNHYTGSGMLGHLQQPMASKDFLQHIKNQMLTGCIRHTKLIKDTIQKVALCGGSGSFLLPFAKSAGADIFITADYKYHEFFDAEDRIIIADIGHYESEQFTGEIIRDFLKDKFPTFAVHLSKVKTNPVNYF